MKTKTSPNQNTVQTYSTCKGYNMEKNIMKNETKIEASANPLWNANMYSQIVTFNSLGNIWDLSITTSEEEHQETLKRNIS